MIALELGIPMNIKDTYILKNTHIKEAKNMYVRIKQRLKK